MPSRLTLILCLLAFAPSVWAELAFDLRAIAGKSVAEVDAVLGKPSSIEKTKQGPKHLYDDGKVEVVFIKGKSDWITLNEMKTTPFDEHVIEHLGLKAEKPTSKKPHVLSWEPHSLFVSISVFPLNGKVDYVYVKVITK